ncbi:MAG: hypothetical protein KC619_23720 [Myxococcales bacterium]|nr:hypothetical protein [Myxococcales bacterium]
MRLPFLAYGLLVASCGASPPDPVEPEPEPIEARDELGPRQPILDGHLTMAAGGEALHAFESSEIVFEPGADPFGPPRFVLRALSLHTRTTGDLITDARVLRSHARAERGPSVHGLQIAWLHEDAPNGAVAPLPVLGALVVHPDGSLQLLQFHIAAELVGERDAYAARARACVEAMRPGPPHASGPATVDLTEALQIDVPEGYSFGSRRAAPPAPAELRAYRLVAPGEPSPTLQVLVRPASRHDEALILAPPDAVRVPGRLLGRDVEWRAFDGDVGHHLAVGVRAGEQWVSIHVRTSNEADERALVAAASTLRRVVPEAATLGR